MSSAIFYAVAHDEKDLLCGGGCLPDSVVILTSLLLSPTLGGGCLVTCVILHDTLFCSSTTSDLSPSTFAKRPLMFVAMLRHDLVDHLPDAHDLGYPHTSSHSLRVHAVQRALRRAL